MKLAAWPKKGQLVEDRKCGKNLRYNPPKSLQTPDASTDSMAVVVDRATNEAMGPPAPAGGN